MRPLSLAWIACLLVWLVGCGQKDDLYLPQDNPPRFETAAPSGAATPATAPDDAAVDAAVDEEADTGTGDIESTQTAPQS